MKKNLLIAALSLAVLVSLFFHPSPPPAMRMWQPMYDKASGLFLCELHFGQDEFATITFRTPQDAVKFAQIRGVEIVMRAAPVRVARSDVVVEAVK